MEQSCSKALHSTLSPSLSSWIFLARPRFFLAITQKILPLTFFLAAFFLSVGLYKGLVVSPPDYLQGELVRIMYVHVPASWMAMLLYGFTAVMSFCVLVWRSPLAELLARSTVPLGALLTTLSLVTGSLWGKPTWGTFWVWDARLTSVLILFFLYAGYGFLYKAWGSRVASFFVVFGTFNLFIIKGSVIWWNTLHQPASVLKLSSPSIHPSLLTPLLLMAVAYFFYCVSCVLLTAHTHLHVYKRASKARFSSLQVQS